jgi:hypothetical protein
MHFKTHYLWYMGKLKINFLYKGGNVEDNPFHQWMGYIQKYQRKYHTSTLNLLEFDGENYQINLDVEQLDNGVDFSSFNYPSQELKNRVIELLYYKDLEFEFRNIIKLISSSEYNDRYEIRALGEKATKLMTQIKDSEIYPELKFERERYIGDIKHTLNQEVEILIKYTKNSSSKSSQRESLNSAVKHLLDDIKFFMIPFDCLKINNVLPDSNKTS